MIKACGVTFVESMVERVIEERCEGDFNRAAEVRKSVNKALDGGLASVRPGSKQALEAKKILAAQGMWSQYLRWGLARIRRYLLKLLCCQPWVTVPALVFPRFLRGTIPNRNSSSWSIPQAGSRALRSAMM